MKNIAEYKIKFLRLYFLIFDINMPNRKIDRKPNKSLKSQGPLIILIALVNSTELNIKKKRKI